MALITNQVLAPGTFLSSLPIVEGQPLIVGGDDAFVTRVMEDLTVTWIVTRGGEYVSITTSFLPLLALPLLTPPS